MATGSAGDAATAEAAGVLVNVVGFLVGFAVLVDVFGFAVLVRASSKEGWNN